MATVVMPKRFLALLALARINRHKELISSTGESLLTSHSQISGTENFGFNENLNDTIVFVIEFRFS